MSSFKRDKSDDDDSEWPDCGSVTSLTQFT